MAESFEARCLRCGAPDPGDKAWCICGASLLVDVVLKAPVGDERKRFTLARAVALLGPPAPAFTQARTSLAVPGEPLVRGVSRAFAQKLLAVLSEHGASAILQSAQEPAAAAPQRSSRAVLVAMLGIGVGVAAAFGVWTSLSPESRKDLAASMGVPALAPKGAGGEVEAMLSTQELAKLATPSTLSLRCAGKMGSGFFVEPELALTNAHVACPPGKLMTVVLPDGRQLIGETVKSDEDLDLATVRVVGANAAPLKLGDVTLLQPGDPLVFIGSPRGLDFTVHEGKVGFLGRHYLGLGYVQFNASVNPGNSGGPLLNGRGEVVGVVSLKIANSDGLGLALPIEYASKLISVPSSPETEARWEELLARVAREEQREVDHFKVEAARPVLVSVKEIEGLGLVAVLLERFDAPPSRARHGVALQAGGDSCSMYVDFEYWKPIQEALKDEKEDSRRIRWVAARGITEGVHVGAARLPVEQCSLPGVGKAWVKLEQPPGPESEGLDRYEVPGEAISAARAAWARHKGGIQAWEQQLGRRRKEEERSREDAGEWRTSFRRARERISRGEEEKRRLEQEVASGRPLRQRLSEVEAELRLANAQLAELERYAAQKNVPQEWRQ
jgi:serine protease Do